MQFALSLTRFIISSFYKNLEILYRNMLEEYVCWRNFCLFCFCSFFNFVSTVSQTILNKVSRLLWFKNKWNQVVIWIESWNWPSNWPRLNFLQIVRCKVLEVIMKLETEKYFQSKVPLAKRKIKSCSIEEMIIWRHN